MTSKPTKFDGRDAHRLALVDGHGEVDGVLLVVQLDVEAGDAGVGIAAVGVERLDALEVGVEAGPIEELRLPCPTAASTL